MCGRYQFSANEEGVIAEINKILTKINEKYNDPQIHIDEIMPTNIAPVIKDENGAADYVIMSWGFRRNDGNLLINSRSERKLYAENYKNRRCVIPASGFYEYSSNNKNPKLPKDKYLFKYPDSPMIYMAGIYMPEETENGRQERFVILTRNANEYIQDIHSRMPVMLYNDEISAWINDDKFAIHVVDRDSVVLVKRLVERQKGIEQISLF